MKLSRDQRKESRPGQIRALEIFLLDDWIGLIVLNLQDVWNRLGAMVMVAVSRIGPGGDISVVTVVLAVCATAAFIFKGGN